jgi:hypothetical protein
MHFLDSGKVHRFFAPLKMTNHAAAANMIGAVH